MGHDFLFHRLSHVFHGGNDRVRLNRWQIVADVLGLRVLLACGEVVIYPVTIEFLVRSIADIDCLYECTLRLQTVSIAEKSH